VKRGDVITVASGASYSGKPRPPVIVQSDVFGGLDSVTTCLITSIDSGPTFARVAVEADQTNNLRVRSWVMIDKVMSIDPRKVGRRLGSLDERTMRRLDGRLAAFLGLVES
jgi:mRNA interferase MazF